MARRTGTDRSRVPAHLWTPARRGRRAAPGGRDRRTTLRRADEDTGVGADAGAGASGGLARLLLAALLGVSMCALLCAPALARVDARVTPEVSEGKAPKVTQQPASVTVLAGESASFEAAASGTPAPSVQWEVSTNGGASFSAVAGATAEKLTIASAKSTESGAEYRAAFANTAGSATSRAATLTVQAAPAVTREPASVTVEAGTTASFEAAASGSPAPSVQWEVSTNGGASFSAVSGATSDVLKIAEASVLESGREYRAVFTNSVGAASSEAATLTVEKRPSMTKQPSSVTVEAGQSATLEAGATGYPEPSAQWEVSTNAGASFTPIAGATAYDLTLTDVQLAESGDEYRAVFTNGIGSVTSAAAKLTVQDRPIVTEQPASVTVQAGQGASFRAAASGVPAPTVQWEESTNGGETFAAVAGANADVLSVAHTTASESGDEYRAVFTNAAGSTTSEAATLTVALHEYRALAWGENNFGQLGDDSFAAHDAPVPVNGVDFVTALAAGARHSLALLADGTVLAWGAGASGQLGDGEFASSAVPVEVEGLHGVQALAAGSNFSLALLRDGTVMAWGSDESGQLGDGGGEETDVPVAVRGLSEVTAIAAGGEHALALLANGTVMAWGAGEEGELGDGRLGDEDVPVAVKGLTGATALAAGSEHSLALLGDGEVMAWGSDEAGQLGSGRAQSGEEEAEGAGEQAEPLSDVPVPVRGLSDVSAIAAGARDSLALLSDGTAMAWGADGSGQLGDGAFASSHEAPVAVAGLTGATAIAAGGEDSMALLSNRTVVTWGEDRFGQLGDGSAGEASDVPVAVGGLGEVAGIAAGAMHDLAYGEPLPAVSAVEPALGGTGGGTSVTITGENLEGATAVRFGASAASSFTVSSAGSITAVAPAHAAGTVDVTVTTPAGTSPAVAGDRFTYAPAPTVTKLSAKDGPGSGGTSVTITGTNLSGATAVSFGSSPATSFAVQSSTEIVASSPPGAGTVDVTVSTPGGTSATSKHDEFGYTPAVTAVEPAGGPLAGGTSVTITGYGFAPGAGATAFKFGSKAPSDVECSSTSTCTALSPAGKKAGAVAVSVEVGKLKSAAGSPSAS